MAKKKPPKKPPIICIYCTRLAIRKMNKKGKPYVSCSSCNSIFFLNNEMSEAGYDLVMEMIYRNLQSHRAILVDRHSKKVIEAQRKIDKDEKEKRKTKKAAN
jgi:hypothetical protein